MDSEETFAPYTMTELDAMMDESEADEEKGRTISSDEMSLRMEEYIESL